MSDDMQGTLPPGWVWTTIGEIASVNPGKSAMRGLADELDISFVPMSAIDEILGAITQPQICRLGEVRKGYTCFVDGDVLFAKITPCMENGKAAIVHDMRNGIGFGSTEFHVIRPYRKVLSAWIFYFIRQAEYRRSARASFTGTAGQLRTPRSFVESSPIPLMSLNEQHRIVAKIEELLTRLDAGVAALKRAQANLKRYKASVLKAACEGKLVPTEAELARAEGRTYEPADVLLRRILCERRSKWEADLRAKGKDPSKVKYVEPQPPDTSGLPELPEGWCWASVNQLVSLITSGSRGWSDYYSEEGAIFIRAQDIKTDMLCLADVAKVSLPHSAEGIRTRVSQNDLLVTITGANVTKTALVHDPISEAYVSQHVALIRPVDTMTSSYLYYWIITPSQGRRFLEKHAYGAGKPGLNLDNLRELVIALPPMTEERRIVVEVDRRISVISDIEATIATNLIRVERLRQAILRRAFSGELIPQNPSGEQTDMLTTSNAE